MNHAPRDLVRRGRVVSFPDFFVPPRSGIECLLLDREPMLPAQFVLQFESAVVAS